MGLLECDQHYGMTEKGARLTRSMTNRSSAARLLCLRTNIGEDCVRENKRVGGG
jgi:hypothetical protein